MEVILKIKRKAPDQAQSEQSYSVDLAEGQTVLDAMIKVREEQDGSLGFRAGCGRGFCGDCAYRINGTGDLACMIPAAKAAKDGEIRLEPVRHIGVVKDLVYDMDSFLFDKVKAVDPWISNGDGATSQEKLMEPEVAEDLQTVMSCVMCGLCDEGCTVIAVDDTFLGPAALTKAYRTVVDPRNDAIPRQLKNIEKPHGVWDCTHCFEANGHCPKAGINPTYRIFAVRDMLIKQGISHKPAQRYHKSFTSSVKHSGWVDEARLAVEATGRFNVFGLLKLLPTALRAMRRGKAPMPYMHEKRPGAADIRRIIERAERKH